MNKHRSVAKLNRTQAHRKAMLRNMATSLFEHERILTTRAKGKALRVYAEGLITQARRNLANGGDPHKTLHRRRLLLQHIRNRSVAKKLLEDIALRFTDRPGGYLRIVHLPERNSDAAQMSIVELVDRREKVKRIATTAPTTEKKEPEAKEAVPATKAKADEPAKKTEEGKWYNVFRKERQWWK